MNVFLFLFFLEQACPIQLTLKNYSLLLWNSNFSELPIFYLLILYIAQNIVHFGYLPFFLYILLSILFQPIQYRRLTYIGISELLCPLASSLIWSMRDTSMRWKDRRRVSDDISPMPCLIDCCEFPALPFWKAIDNVMWSSYVPLLCPVGFLGLWW